MPHVVRQPAASGGAAANSVAEGAASGMASIGPPGAARLDGITPIVSGIEEGPHNTTRWWALGHAIPAPSGHDKTTLLLTVDEEGIQRSLQALAQSARVLAVYERPRKRSLDGHRHVIDVVGHASQPEIASLPTEHAEFRLLGSYLEDIEYSVEARAGCGIDRLGPVVRRSRPAREGRVRRIRSARSKARVGAFSA